MRNNALACPDLLYSWDVASCSGKVMYIKVFVLCWVCGVCAGSSAAIEKPSWSLLDVLLHRRAAFTASHPGLNHSLLNVACSYFYSCMELWLCHIAAIWTPHWNTHTHTYTSTRSMTSGCLFMSWLASCPKQTSPTSSLTVDPHCGFSAVLGLGTVLELRQLLYYCCCY